MIFCMLLTGLVLGAISPPFLYGIQNGLAAILNAIGLLMYAASLSTIIYAVATINPAHIITTKEIAIGVGFTLGSFAAVEGLVFLLRHYLRKRVENTPL